MKKFILLTLTILSISTASFAKNDVQENNVVVKNNIDETIEKYISVRRILLTEFRKIKEDLFEKDKENFQKIQTEIYKVISSDRKNMDAKLITKYVVSVGSSRFLNEYKALFYTIHNEENLLCMYPDEINYILDDNGRILYFEAKNMLTKGTSQVYDRSLLQRFVITKQKVIDRLKFDFK